MKKQSKKMNIATLEKMAKRVLTKNEATAVKGGGDIWVEVPIF